MTTAKLNIKHDYITMTATFSKEVRANLTFSRYSMKASGKGLTGKQMNDLLRFFDILRTKMDKKETSFTNPGEMMEAVRLMAEQSDTPEALALKMEEACWTAQVEAGK